MTSLKDMLNHSAYNGLPKKVLKRLDGHAEAIFRLKVHGVITETEKVNAWIRLVKLIKQEINKHTKP